MSNADALQVFSIGDFEYKYVIFPVKSLSPDLLIFSYIWNAADNATVYNQLTIGMSPIVHMAACLQSV